jgi:hypothetical protein
VDLKKKLNKKLEVTKILTDDLMQINNEIILTRASPAATSNKRSDK